MNCGTCCFVKLQSVQLHSNQTSNVLYSLLPTYYIQHSLDEKTKQKIDQKNELSREWKWPSSKYSHSRLQKFYYFIHAPAPPISVHPSMQFMNSIVHFAWSYFLQVLLVFVKFAFRTARGAEHGWVGYPPWVV